MAEQMRPNTAFLLMAQYNGAAVIPIEFVVRDYFRHLTVENMVRKVLAGQISLPITRMEKGQESARGVHLNDLADYIDKQRESARREAAQLVA